MRRAACGAERLRMAGQRNDDFKASSSISQLIGLTARCDLSRVTKMLLVHNLFINFQRHTAKVHSCI